jgi:hypothetical protein
MPTLKDSPRIDSAGRANAGSQKQIQMYVNERPQDLGAAVGESLLWYGLEVKDIQWVSPLAEESYLQYRDSEFLQRVGLGRLAPELQDYWPQGRVGMPWRGSKAGAFSSMRRVMSRKFTVAAAKSLLPKAWGRFKRRWMRRKAGWEFHPTSIGREGFIRSLIAMRACTSSGKLQAFAHFLLMCTSYMTR